MKKQCAIGIVTKINGEFAFVRPTAHTACDSGHCCQGEGVSKVVLEMKNEINAVVGDKVIYEAKEVGMLIVAFILFVMPLILAFFGAVMGYYISGSLGINASTASIIGGISLFIISIIIIKIFDRFVSENSNLRPVIIKRA